MPANVPNGQNAHERQAQPHRNHLRDRRLMHKLMYKSKHNMWRLATGGLCRLQREGRSSRSPAHLLTIPLAPLDRTTTFWD